MDSASCMACSKTFSPGELELASDGSGMLCAPCKLRREAPDLGSLVRKDARRRGSWMIVLGTPVFGLGVLLLYFVWDVATSPNPFLSDVRIGRPAALAVGALVLGAAAILVGIQTLASSRRRS
jgi:hypothetical protein